jgi:hypothetical protein
MLSGTSEGLWPIVFLALLADNLLFPTLADKVEVLAIVRFPRSSSRRALNILRVGLTTVIGLAATAKAFRNMINACRFRRMCS